jgi:hypothetical protein
MSTTRSDAVVRSLRPGLYFCAIRLLVLVPACCLLGCGPSGARPDPSDATRQNLEAIGNAYLRSTTQHNHPPTGREELAEAIRLSGQSEDVLRSPNDGEEFVLVWNVELRRLKAYGNSVPILAYEKQGKNGRRYVLRGRADVVLLSDSQLRASVFPPGVSAP